MWMFFALGAAVIWGISYAASGRVIERGMTPLTFFLFYSLFGSLAAAVALAVSGRAAAMPSELRALGGEWVWFVVAVIASVAGTMLIYLAIGEKNATLASLIEISYPFFVAFFSWLFFRAAHLNWPTAAGGLLILCGVTVVFLANRQ